MDNLVLYIEKEKFLRMALEEVFKRKGGKLHTEEKLKDHFYLIDDLKPSILFFDLKTVINELDEIKQLKNIKLVATGDEEDEKLAQAHQFKFIKKPIIILSIFDQLTKEEN